MRFTFLVAAIAMLVLTACEGKKSLDGYPMDKPPPSAYGPRDSEPAIPEAVEPGKETDGSYGNIEK